MSRLAPPVVRVTRFEVDSEDVGQTFEVSLLRLPPGMRSARTEPPAGDVPADVRAALLEWLTAPVDGPLVEGDLADVRTALADAVRTLRALPLASDGQHASASILDELHAELAHGSALLYRAAP